MIGEIIPLHLRAVLSSASLKRLLHKWTQCTVCCHIIRRSPVELASHCLRALNYFSFSFSLKKAKGGKEGGVERGFNISKDTVAFLVEGCGVTSCMEQRCVLVTLHTSDKRKNFCHDILSICPRETLPAMPEFCLSSFQPIAVKLKKALGLFLISQSYILFTLLCDEDVAQSVWICPFCKLVDFCSQDD